MFFFIIGWGPRVKDLGAAGYHTCPRCGNHVMRRRLERRNWLTVFFLPVLPMSRQTVLACPVCIHEEPAP